MPSPNIFGRPESEFPAWFLTQVHVQRAHMLLRKETKVTLCWLLASIADEFLYPWSMLWMIPLYGMVGLRNRQFWPASDLPWKQRTSILRGVVIPGIFRFASHVFIIISWSMPQTDPVYRAVSYLWPTFAMLECFCFFRACDFSRSAMRLLSARSSFC